MADAAIEQLVYDGQNVALKFNGAGSLTTHRYLHGQAADQVLAEEQAGNWASANRTYWTLGEHLGTVRDIANQIGVLKDHIAYDALGKVTSETSTTINVPYGFTGFWYDRDTKLNFSETRVYDAATGTWMQQDFIGFAGGDANLMRYVNNSPTNSVDPTGFFKTYIHHEITMAAAKAAGVIGYVQRHIADATVQIDLTDWDVQHHAQHVSFVQEVGRRMTSIADAGTSSTPTALQEKPNHKQEIRRAVISDIGWALHNIQDFYSHTDWIDGKNLCPLYRTYGDLDLAQKGASHEPHHRTLSLALLAKFDDQEVRDVIYFTGGEKPWGKDDNHNRYAVDEAGFGRSDPTVPGAIPGAFGAARRLALRASIDFLQWVRKNMKTDVIAAGIFDGLFVGDKQAEAAKFAPPPEDDPKSPPEPPSPPPAPWGFGWKWPWSPL